MNDQQSVCKHYTVIPFVVDCYFGIKSQLWSSRHNQEKQLYDAKWELPSRKIDRNNLAHSIEMFFPPSFGKIPIEVSKWRSQFRLRIGNGRTHYHLAVLLPESLLFVFDFSAGNGERTLFLCPKSVIVTTWWRQNGSSADENDARETEDRKEGAEESLRTLNFSIPPLGSCPRKTVLGLPLFTARLTMRACVDQPRRGWARKT